MTVFVERVAAGGHHLNDVIIGDGSDMTSELFHSALKYTTCRDTLL